MENRTKIHKGDGVLEITAYLGKEHHIILNKQQTEAVNTDARRLMLLAVPGAGKTTVIAVRIARLMAEDGVSPNRILTVTFSRESARDMSRRFNELFSGLCGQIPEFSTIHSFCYQILRRYAKQHNRPMPRLLTEDGARLNLIKRAMLDINDQYPDDDTLEEVSLLIGRLKNSMWKPADEATVVFDTASLPQIFSRYDELKAEAGLMDFDDLLTYALDILKKKPEILAFYQNKYAHVNLDEAQDATLLQHEILRLVAAHCNLCIVGDEDQSIYSFRGADPKAILDFAILYPDALVLKMEESFRCPQSLVSAAGRLISQNSQRIGKIMMTLVPDVLLPKASRVKNSHAQNEYLIACIRQALDHNESTAILYRNWPSSIGLVDLLDRNGFEFYIRRQNASFRMDGIVQDVLAIIRLSQQPSDIEAFTRVYYKLSAYISRKMWQYVFDNHSENESVFDCLLRNEGENMNSARILFIKGRLARFHMMTPVAVVDTIFDRLGYQDFLAARTAAGYQLELIAQKVSALKHIASLSFTLSAFQMRIEELDRIFETHSQTSASAQLTLTTIHSAKGMEFDRVFLIDLLDGILPSTRAIEESALGKNGALEEEVRLCYVAVTRAKKGLEIIYPQLLGKDPLSPSRFIGVLFPDYAPDRKPLIL